MPSSITVLASHLHTAGGIPEYVRIAETGALASGNDITFSASPGVYHLETYGGEGTYGSFTVASDGTISGTTGALVATGNAIDFDLTKLDPVAVSPPLTSSGKIQSVLIGDVTVASPFQGTDTAYVPAGTFSLTDQAGQNPYGSLTVSDNGSGILSVSGATGAVVATGNTITFDLTKLAAVTVVGADLTTAAGHQEFWTVGQIVSEGSFVGPDTVYLPAGTFNVDEASEAAAYGSFTVGANGSGTLAVTATSGAAVAVGNTIHFDLTKLAAVTVYGTDLKTAAGVQQAVGVETVDPHVDGTDTEYLPAFTFNVTDGTGQRVYGTFTVAANGPGSLVVTGTSGAATATGNSIHFDPCDVNEVRITPNAGVSWYVPSLNFHFFSASDVDALSDGSYTLDLNGSSGSTSTTFSVSSASGLSATQLPQGSPLVTLALVPCVPVVGPITAPLTPVPVNTAVAASASFTDPDALETHTAVWNWGDGTTSAGTVTESNGSGSVSGSHAYTADGVYTITLTVTDNNGASGESTFSYLVVYNPSAGFTTGGGWFNSPAGAYAANPALTGKATFGLNAKYKPGATVPTGNTEFQFPAANLNFHATSYDWLVITTNQAQYQGSGTINGAGNYGFLVTAQDNGGASPDDIRLEIWDKSNNNAVVYDTQPGAPTTAAPTTALGGGRIQVHTNAQLAAGGASPSGGNAEPLTPEELSPIVQEAIAHWQEAGISPAQLSALSQVTVGIAEFPGPWLGMAFPGSIWIDQTAAGYGWYIDPTPADDSEFPASPGGPAYGKMDLLTVVEHELGHELGYGDNDGSGLMGVFLAPGVRRAPAPAPLAGLANGAVQGGAVAAPPGLVSNRAGAVGSTGLSGPATVDRLFAGYTSEEASLAALLLADQGDGPALDPTGHLHHGT